MTSTAGTARFDRRDAEGARRSEPEPYPVGDPVEPWPRGVSRAATMRISDVLTALKLDFPAVSNSKLRFLEEQGLVGPVRTSSGYRQYSPADLERLRYVLRAQRDRYLPLRVIREQLAALDSGLGDAAPPPPRLATRDGERANESVGRYSGAALAADAGVDEQLVNDLVQAGVIHAGPSGQFDPWARDVVAVAGMLAEHGVDARHLRAFKAAAERQVDLVEQIIAPWRSQHGTSARARAGTLAAELGELCGQLHTALLRAGVADLAP